MKRNILIVVLVVVAAIILRYTAGAIGNFISERKAGKTPPPSVLIETIGEHDVIRSFEAPGRVNSQYQVNVLARISGYLLKSYFNEGDYVKAGQVLFLIEPAEYVNAVNVAAGNVENTRAKLEYAEKQLARAEELVKQDYIAKARYDEILSQRDSLRAQLASQQAALADSQRNYGYTRIKAPVDGKIGIINVTIGNFVTPSSGALTTINSSNPIYVTFPINTEDYTSLSTGDSGNDKNRKVELYFSDGRKYKFDGVQDFQDNKIDLTTGTVTLRATFQNNDNELVHGDFVNVKLYANNKVKFPVVHVTAVQENQEGKYVYKLDEQNVPQLTYIKTSGQSGDYWIVTEGVQVGDKIVADGIQKVRPGQPVTVVTPEEMEKIKKNEQEEAQDKE